MGSRTRGKARRKIYEMKAMWDTGPKAERRMKHETQSLMMEGGKGPSVSSSGPAAAGVAPPGAKTEAASLGCSRAQKGVVWLFDAETSRWPSGWNVSARTFESCAWESVA
jgi:hypothetical protein